MEREPGNVRSRPGFNRVMEYDENQMIGPSDAGESATKSHPRNYIRLLLARAVTPSIRALRAIFSDQILITGLKLVMSLKASSNVARNQPRWYGPGTQKHSSHQHIFPARAISPYALSMPVSSHPITRYPHHLQAPSRALFPRNIPPTSPQTNHKAEIMLHVDHHPRLNALGCRDVCGIHMRSANGR